MAEFSGPFTGSSISTELQWSRMARWWGLDGVHADDAADLTLKVTGSGATTVAVATGRAFVNGFYYDNDATKNLAVPANAGGSARVDLVVLRASQSANSVTAVYKEGGVTAPPLTQEEDGVWEIPLAQCTVAAGSTVVMAVNVADRRYFTDRGVVPAVPGVRPTSRRNQLLVDNGKLYVGDGSAWRWIATAGIDDSTYTPVWNSAETTINWGVGSTNIGRYQAVGKRVDVTIQLIPTGNPPEYTEPIQVTLPPGLPCTTAFRSLFKWNYTSDNDEGSAVGIGMTFPTTDGTNKIARLRFPTSTGNSVLDTPNSLNLLTNRPFNIRAGDVLTIDGSYWLA
ncbi:hypothetical protein [Streptomyces europaeiscabiei]|uniref:hypothetical protein n=1 Tax=Streptomyces europaeiscabiei TaxID=146819 RepID=UPI002E252A4A|nr:hypothetical protein OG858_47820 [Streptomyces europaeiscabiei]